MYYESALYERTLEASKDVTPEPHTAKIKNPLADKIVARLLPLYQRLASDSLLNRCVAGKTQNANEALHNVIWSSGQRLFQSKQKFEIGLCEAICEYNTGYLKTLSTFQEASGVSPGTNTAKIANKVDRKRLQLSKARKISKYEVYSKKLKVAQLEEQRKKEKDGLSYGAGEF